MRDALGILLPGALVVALALTGCASPPTAKIDAAPPDTPIPIEATFTVAPVTKVAGIIPVGAGGGFIVVPQRPADVTWVELWLLVTPSEGVPRSQAVLFNDHRDLGYANGTLPNGTYYLTANNDTWLAGQLQVRFPMPDGLEPSAYYGIQVDVTGGMHHVDGADAARKALPHRSAYTS